MENFTTSETKWIKAFESLLKSMPKTLEVIAHHGQTLVCDKGTRDRAFKSDGDTDNVDSHALKSYSILKSPILPNESCT